MDKEKQRQEASLIGRIFSTEALILVMGCISLFYGVTQQKMISIFWGVMILCGFFILRFVRKKDWNKHWEGMEAEKKAREDYIAQKKRAETEKNHE